jgi:hypothetical protein
LREEPLGEEGAEAKIMNANPSSKKTHGTTTRSNRKARHFQTGQHLGLPIKELGEKENIDAYSSLDLEYRRK